MIVLDTNVISEIISEEPDFNVLLWANRVERNMWTTAVTVAELRVGIENLPEGRKRSRIAKATDRMLNEAFRERILPFDLRAADHYGRIWRTRKDAGRPIDMADGEIAAICRSREAKLATRNIKDFEGIGITLIDPWNS